MLWDSVTRCGLAPSQEPKLKLVNGAVLHTVQHVVYQHVKQTCTFPLNLTLACKRERATFVLFIN